MRRDPPFCIDRTASSDFLFRLQPGEPKRFLPIGGFGRDTTQYQLLESGNWPQWGHGDLWMGNHYCMAGQEYCGSVCDQGHTYAGFSNEACGGSHWGPTDVEVWFLEAATRAAPHRGRPYGQ